MRSKIIFVDQFVRNDGRFQVNYRVQFDGHDTLIIRVWIFESQKDCRKGNLAIISELRFREDALDMIGPGPELDVVDRWVEDRVNLTHQAAQDAVADRRARRLDGMTIDEAVIMTRNNTDKALWFADRIQDVLSYPVDSNIKPLVAGLLKHGFTTIGSCEGHADRGCPYPWVDFNHSDEAHRDLSLLLEGDSFWALSLMIKGVIRLKPRDDGDLAAMQCEAVAFGERLCALPADVSPSHQEHSCVAKSTSPINSCATTV